MVAAFSIIPNCAFGIYFVNSILVMTRRGYFKKRLSRIIGMVYVLLTCIFGAMAMILYLASLILASSAMFLCIAVFFAFAQAQAIDVMLHFGAVLNRTFEKELGLTFFWGKRRKVIFRLYGTCVVIWCLFAIIYGSVVVQEVIVPMVRSTMIVSSSFTYYIGHACLYRIGLVKSGSKHTMRFLSDQRLTISRFIFRNITITVLFLLFTYSDAIALYYMHVPSIAIGRLLYPFFYGISGVIYEAFYCSDEDYWNRRSISVFPVGFFVDSVRASMSTLTKRRASWGSYGADR